MPAIKPSSLRDLKARVNLLEVVSRVMTVRKVGSRFRGLCPFHQEKTPSFYVNPDNGFYKCFGCGKAGDAITFVRETEGLTFVESVETLAKRFGVPLEYEEGTGPSREERSLRQELFDLHELAAEHFHQVFKGRDSAGEFMRAYWTGKRLFPLELADEFKIGAADQHGSELAAVLMKNKFSEDALRQCGLFFAPREGGPLMLGSLRHRFRGRLMIPIRDHQGRVVAFTARQTELTPADDPAREAKYVNSPETPIFTKGNLLFNLDRARTNVGDGRPFIMVEGQLDALRCWHVGLKTTIAPQGTAITDTQLGLLRRYHPQIECFLDGDSAGQKAAMRLLPLALKAEIEVKFLVLDPGMDPDSLFRERGLPAYEEIRQRGLSSMAFASSVLLANPLAATTEERTRAMQAVFQIVDQAASEVLRRNYLEEAAHYLKAPRKEELLRDYESYRRRTLRQNPLGNQALGPSAASEIRPPELDLLLLCLHFEALGKPLAHELLARDWIDTNQLSGRILWRFLTEFEQGTWPGRDHLDGLLETPEEMSLVATLLFESPEVDNPERVVDDTMRQLEYRHLKLRWTVLEQKIALARDMDGTATKESRIEFTEITKRMVVLRNEILGRSSRADRT
jgi:DNA primase